MVSYGFLLLVYGLVVYGHVLSCMAMYGHVLSYLVMINQLGGNIGNVLNLVTRGHIGDEGKFRDNWKIWE